MKTINIRKDQIQEIAVAADVRPGENLGDAAKRTVKDANSELGSNKVDSVSFSPDEILLPQDAHLCSFLHFTIFSL